MRKRRSALGSYWEHVRRHQTLFLAVVLVGLLAAFLLVHFVGK